MNEKDRYFEGTVPVLYDEYLVPLIFEPYADDIAKRTKELGPKKILEIACGTGAVTRALASSIDGAEITAIDLNQPMLDRASSIGTARPVSWQKADALELPFADESFDVVVCQFAAMFFPDKPTAYREARRVLTNGGAYIFSVWDRIEFNEIADVVTSSLAMMFPSDPPLFLARTPHGHHDLATIRNDLAAAGFSRPHIETVALRSVARSAHDAAIAYCQGTPVRDELYARDSSRIDEATRVAENAIAERWGSGPIDARMQAHIIVAHKE
jgi:ubiquinone/menaquinone biosynthesis C-methylase UbiE